MSEAQPSLVERGYPELLADLADQVAAKLAENGIELERAADIGLAVAEHVRSNWSGQSLYLPQGYHYELSLRDQEIFERFDGHNHEPLARDYNLSVMRIYQIVKAVRAEMIRKRQGSLF